MKITQEMVAKVFMAERTDRPELSLMETILMIRDGDSLSAVWCSVSACVIPQAVQLAGSMNHKSFSSGIGWFLNLNKA
jgi:hypothetical protein